MKKIMILGASELQIPAILKAKEMGLYVVVADMNPRAIGITFADKFYEVSTIDKEKILEIALIECVSGIMTIATDFPMRTVAYVCDHMGLHGIDYETSIRATDKGVMRKALEDKGVPIPKYRIVENYSEYCDAICEINGSKIVKPIDNSGSRGIYLLTDDNEMDKAFHYTLKNSRGNKILVEEFMTGAEVSVESITYNGETNIIAITDKLTTGAPHFVELRHCQPSSLDIGIINAIQEITKKAIQSIGITNGPSHTEIKITSEGPKIVEIGARLGGDFINTHLTPLSTGVDIVKLNIQLAIGEKISIPTKENHAALVRFIEGKKGVFKSVSGTEFLSQDVHLKEFKIYNQSGDYITKTESSSNRIGYFILYGDDIKTLLELDNQYINNIQVNIQEEEK